MIIAVIYATKAVARIKPEKNSGLNGIRTHDLCDTGAVLYPLSYQANWELVIISSAVQIYEFSYIHYHLIT